ncbi:MAG: hypothetical protein ACOH2V_00345 [Candidatus Saccharimonadaceae bacterium]
MEEEDTFIVLKGLFKDNAIYCDDGSIFETSSFGVVKEVIEGRRGFFHLKPMGNIGYMIFEYVLDV